ncbi:secretion protein HlyD [Desulfoluna limicola]|uniref:Secretion protein HlyD n=1 Tax=Desulfoluna limicola TaxID=2810562 RepID=A0ABN6F104_9BACT|nr:efflux RND transporter periplasmic adaptor subunit [Desulfoluna limicola]BCS95295.1 secretion protein HlyD [Desulfoluna limicola]
MLIGRIKEPYFRVHRPSGVKGLFAAMALGLVAVASSVSAQEAGGAAFKAPVSVMTMTKQTIQYTQTVPGRVQAHKIAEVRPQVTGIVLERFFEEGGMVEKGQPLYQIDPSTYKAVYDSAKADLLNAQAQLESSKARAERYGRLVEDRAVSRQDYDDAHAAWLQARASVAVADASVAQAKINLDYTRVYAPITGRIGKSTVTEGALVTANQATMMAEITQLDPIYVDMQQAREKLFELKKKSTSTEKIMVRLDYGDSQGEYPRMGELQFSEVTVDPTTSSVVLRALFPNPDEELYPGFFVSATLLLDKADVLMIPQKAAILQPSGTMVAWVMDKANKVHPQPIEVKGSYKNNWIVTSGLSEGDAIVTEGFQRLQPGAEVDSSQAVLALAN